MGNPWDPESCAFNQSAAGWLGRKRPEMLVNPLLVKPLLGRPITRGIKLPPIDTTYGMITSDRDRTMELVLRGWDMVNVCGEEKKKKAFGLGSFVDNSSTFERPPPPVFHPKQLFGKKTRGYPWDVDMAALLSNEFQKISLEEIKRGKACQHDILLMKKKATKVRDPRQYYENRTCQLRKIAMSEKVEPTEPWRIKRFLEVPPHLSTFRSPEELERALKVNAFERVGRLGQTGQGLPVPSQRRNLKSHAHRKKDAK